MTDAQQTVIGNTSGTNTGDQTLSISGNDLTISGTGGNTVTLPSGGSETDPIVGAISGIIKSDGAGAISSAIAGTDYLVSEVDGSISNEGSLTVVAGGANTSEIQSNTSTSSNIVVAGGTDITVTETGNTITIASTAAGGARPFGELYDNSTISIPVTTTFAVVTGFTLGSFSDVTLGTDGITILTDGHYFINYSTSFTTSTNNFVVASSIFKNNVELFNIGWLRKIGTGSDIGSAKASGIVSLTKGDEITVQLRSVSGSSAVNFSKINLSIYRID